MVRIFTWVVALSVLGSPLYAQFTTCSTPALPVPLDAVTGTNQDTLTVTDSIVIEDLLVSFDITHEFVGDLILDVTSPLGTQVRLHQSTGGANDNMLVTFWSDGGANGVPDYLGGNLQQPGPGPLALDVFTGEVSDGLWTLDAEGRCPQHRGSTDHPRPLR